MFGVSYASIIAIVVPAPPEDGKLQAVLIWLGEYPIGEGEPAKGEIYMGSAVQLSTCCPKAEMIPIGIKKVIINNEQIVNTNKSFDICF